MGLGKSLSMLAVIAHTLTEAQAYRDMGNQGEAKHRTAATLLITPKTSMNDKCFPENADRFKQYKAGRTRYYGKHSLPRSYNSMS